MYTAKVSAKGWVVIPKELREKYGLKRGTRVQVVAYDEALALVPLPDDPVGALHGMLEGGPSLTGDLLQERAHERTRLDSSVRLIGESPRPTIRSGYGTRAGQWTMGAVGYIAAG